MKILKLIMLFLLILNSGIWAEPGNTKRIHPSWTFTNDDLNLLGEGMLPEEYKRLKEHPPRFLDLLSEIFRKEEVFVRLVNKQNTLPRDYIPKDLVALDDYREDFCLSRRGHRLRKVILPALKAMSQGAEKEGIRLMISSAYRSWDYQKMLFERYTAQDGLEAAERYSARPGASQHQLGTVMDFGSIDDSFAETRAGKWLKEHAWEYGFSLSYPRGMEALTGYVWESWHYRYIGLAACRMEREFFAGLQERMLRYLQDKKDLFKRAYSTTTRAASSS